MHPKINATVNTIVGINLNQFASIKCPNCAATCNTISTKAIKRPFTALDIGFDCSIVSIY